MGPTRALSRRPMRGAGWFLLALTACVFVLAGCGNSRTPVPGLTASLRPGMWQSLSFPAYGIAIKAPSHWINSPGRPPLIATVSMGDSVVALWRYSRSTPPPLAASALAAARARLIAAARQRDPSFRLIAASTVSLRSYAVIELDAFERLGGRPRRVRSTHVFTGILEVVLDEYAPVAAFHAVDHAVFSPLKNSLRVSPAPTG